MNDPAGGRTFTIRASRRRRQLLHGLHIAALAACWLNGLPPWLRLAAGGLCAASWRQQLRACRGGEIHLRHAADGGWLLAAADAKFAPIEILADSVTGRYLSIIQYRRHGRRQALPVFADALAGDDYRRLVVRLRIDGMAGQSRRF